MDQKEYRAWQEVTDSSRGQWILDSVMSTRGTLMLYRGGNNGMYVSISPRDHRVQELTLATAVDLQVGEYQNALPHIAEALFLPKFERSFGNVLETLKYLSEHAPVVHRTLEHQVRIHLK